MSGVQKNSYLLQVLSNWQRFRDEQLILLNWLSSKEKILKDMGRTDLTDEDEVKDHLAKLRVRDIYITWIALLSVVPLLFDFD